MPLFPNLNYKLRLSLIGAWTCFETKSSKLSLEFQSPTPCCRQWVIGDDSMHLIDFDTVYSMSAFTTKALN